MAAALSEPGPAMSDLRGTGTGFLMPEQEGRTGEPLLPMGDPFGIRNRVYYSDTHTVGKPWGVSRHNGNIWTNIRGINSIAERYFGRIVSKIQPTRKERIVPGEQQTFKTNVNLERPPSTPYGDFATYLADGTERIGGR